MGPYPQQCEGVGPGVYRGAPDSGGQVIWLVQPCGLGCWGPRPLGLWMDPGSLKLTRRRVTCWMQGSEALRSRGDSGR